MEKHKEHTKKRMYIRDQDSNAKQWRSTEIFMCECGAILERKFNLGKVEVVKE